MLILTVRTDKPEAEIGLYEDEFQVAYVTWEAHRQLAETIHLKVEELLKSHGKKLDDLQGIVGFEGPGSFTGLRIGLTVVNALGEGLSIPVSGARGENWIGEGTQKLLDGKAEQIVLPEYGAPAHITEQKK